jgi:asparagine synthase (glutamine-hydrolysing)
MANIRPERHTEVGLGPRISDIQHMADAQDEPFGGFPTIGMGNVYWSGREAGTPIMLDGVGLDDAAAGYTYYADIKRLRPAAPYITGSLSHGLKPKAMSRAFQEYTKPFLGETGTKDPLLARQLVDLQYLKMPRMLRFNDRAAGMYGCENRSPFLDHRIVEMLMRQPPKHKIGPGQEGKWIVRKVAERLGLPNWNEPKSRKAQTPQREWLVGPLREWTREQVSAFIASCPEWVDAPVMTTIMEREVANPSENNFFLWQWAMAGMYLRA